MSYSRDGHNELQNSRLVAGQPIVGPSYLSPAMFFGKPSALNLRVDFTLECPETDRALYPTYVVDDLSRVRIFEIHRLISSGVIPWSENESHRLECHIDRDCIALYSYKQALIYRVRHYLSGLKVDLCPITNLPLSRNIGDQLQLFSPSNSAADLSVSQDQLRDWAAFAPVPLSISLSLRDVSDIWIESTSNIVVRLKFHSGFVLDFITRDAMDLVVCLLARLRVLNIFVIHRDEVLYQAPIEMARKLAHITAAALENPDSSVFSPYKVGTLSDVIAEASENRPRVRTLIPMKNHSLRPVVQNSLDLSPTTDHELQEPRSFSSSSVSAPWSPHSLSNLTFSKPGNEKGGNVTHNSSTDLPTKGFITNSSAVSSSSPATKFSLRKQRSRTTHVASSPSRRLSDPMKQSLGRKKVRDDGM